MRAVVHQPEPPPPPPSPPDEPPPEEPNAPGSSGGSDNSDSDAALIVSDNALSDETDDSTDFIVLTA